MYKTSLQVYTIFVFLNYTMANFYSNAIVPRSKSGPTVGVLTNFPNIAVEGPNTPTHQHCSSLLDIHPLLQLLAPADNQP